MCRHSHHTHVVLTVYIAFLRSASYSMFGLLKGSRSVGGSVFWRMVFEIFGHGLLLFWWLQE
jgi:hypothetical protein